MKRGKELRLLALTLANIIAVIVFLSIPPASIPDIGPDTGHAWSDRAEFM